MQRVCFKEASVEERKEKTGENTSNREEEMKERESRRGFNAPQMEFRGPFLNDGSSSFILRVISNCF